MNSVSMQETRWKYQCQLLNMNTIQSRVFAELPRCRCRSTLLKDAFNLAYNQLKSFEKHKTQTTFHSFAIMTFTFSIIGSLCKNKKQGSSPAISLPSITALAAITVLSELAMMTQDRDNANWRYCYANLRYHQNNTVSAEIINPLLVRLIYSLFSQRCMQFFFVYECNGYVFFVSLIFGYN